MHSHKINVCSNPYYTVPWFKYIFPYYSKKNHWPKEHADMAIVIFFEKK